MRARVKAFQNRFARVILDCSRDICDGLCNKKRSAPFQGTSGHRCLDLLGTPACVGLAHVARWLDRGDEFESNVADTDNADNAASNVSEDVPTKKKTTKKDIDYDMELDLL